MARQRFRLRVFPYLESNNGSTIAYGNRYGKHKPILTATAESTVNLKIEARMCKRRQMHWTPRGAHLLVQVRCAVIHGDPATKLVVDRAGINEIPEDMGCFLRRLQSAVAAESGVF